nr:metallophosphoesterase [uncultured Porphyromonas sp.]
MISMILITLLLLLAGVGYTGWHLATLAPLPLIWRWVIGLGWLVLFVLVVLSFVFRAQLSVALTRFGYPVVTSWVFYLLYLVMIFLAIDLLRLVPQLRPWLVPSWPLVGCVALVMVGVFAWGSSVYHTKVRVPLTIQLDKPLARPLKIIGLSDLHLGYSIGREELSRWVDLINSERPDLVLIAGDIVDGDVRPVLEDGMAEELNRIEAPIYACLGNHEYLGGEAHRRQFLSQTKVQLLCDSVATLGDQLYIIGRDDETNPQRKSLAQLTAGLDRSKPILLLDHQPHHLEQAQRAGIDFQLSGHTHRGQVFPINLIVDRMYEQSHGYHRRGRTQYYVSSGIGIWGGKYRIGTQSEYVVIQLMGRAG